MSTDRGPSGAEALPPADLAVRPLPLYVHPKDDPVLRVHQSRLGPVFYGPGVGTPPTYRFDSGSGHFGVLYLAPQPETALIETILRNPQRMTVSYREIEHRSISTLDLNRDLRLVDATGANLSAIGATAALFAGPYGPCGDWSDAFFSHPDKPDGILYPSRHNPDRLCIALFERADLLLSVRETTPLAGLQKFVGLLLDQHGKSLFGAP